MPNRPNVLVVAMGYGGLAPLLAALDRGLRARGLSSLIWAMGGGDGGVDLLRAEGLSAYTPLRDYQLPYFMNELPDSGYAAEHELMAFYRAFERGAAPDSRVGEEGLELIARWGRYIQGRAEELLDVLRPSAMLVQSGVRLVEGALAVLARERDIPLLFVEKGAFPNTLLVDELGVGPLSLYGDLERWRSDRRDLGDEDRKRLEAFRDGFRRSRASAWDQPEGRGDLRARLGLSRDRRILFVPGQVRHDANTVLYSPCYPDNESFLRHLLAASEGLDLFVVAKPHPKEKRDESHLATLLEGRGAWLPQLNVHDALETADLVACLNSTVGLEALLYGRPVISGARAFWAGKGFTFDLLEDGGNEALGAFLAEAPSPDPALLDPFLHHLITRGSYGEPSEPWPSMDALADRLAAMARPTEGDPEAARAWMANAEADALRREGELAVSPALHRLMPFFD